MHTPGSTAARVATPTLDHLVVMAASLEEAVTWCEATLGVIPGPGGEHPLMGTHNRLLKIATPDFPQAYLELIAINSGAASHGFTRARRWFDMGEPTLRERVQRGGPQLIHWVASVDNIAATVAALAAQNVDRGDVLQASRQTPYGLLQWQISVRADGQRLFDGCLPTLIQWGDSHPTQAMASSGVTLHSLRVQHPQADGLRQALAATGFPALPVTHGAAQLTANLQTPNGMIEIHS